MITPAVKPNVAQRRQRRLEELQSFQEQALQAIRFCCPILLERAAQYLEDEQKRLLQQQLKDKSQEGLS